MWLYESHLGGIYLTSEQRDYEFLYCEQCGDSDWEVGEFETVTDLLNAFACDIDVDGSGGYSMSYVLEVLREGFTDVPSLEDALEMIRDIKMK